MTTKCGCGGRITPNMDKLKTVLRDGVLIAVIAAAFGLGGGWLSLFAAAWGGSKVAHYLLRAKIALLKERSKHSFFKCSRCDREVSVQEVFE